MERKIINETPFMDRRLFNYSQEPKRQKNYRDSNVSLDRYPAFNYKPNFVQKAVNNGAKDSRNIDPSMNSQPPFNRSTVSNVGNVNNIGNVYYSPKKIM